MTVKSLLANISSSELTEWMSYYSYKNELENKEEEKEQPKTSEVLKAQFGHLVKKKR